MDPETDYIREFLAHMGVKADVRLDSSNQKVIIIETEVYLLRRNWIETWFTLIDQDEHNSFFHERPRGTGQTL